MNQITSDFCSHWTRHSLGSTDDKSLFIFNFIVENDKALALWSLASVGVYCILYNNAPCFLTTPRLDRYYPQYDAVSAWNIILINTTSILNHILKPTSKPGLAARATAQQVRHGRQARLNSNLHSAPVIQSSYFLSSRSHLDKNQG